MFIGLFLTIFFFYKIGRKDIGISLSCAVLIWTGYIYSMTEFLSLFNLVSKSSIITSIIAYDLVWVVCFFTKRKNGIKMNKCKNILPEKELFFLLIVVSCIVLPFSQLMTIYHPDSLNYHLPRIYMWCQNRSVAHFATSDTRMIGSPPLKEFVDLWVYLIYGEIHEQLMNLTQLVSYCINILLVYSIAGFIGVKGKYKLFAAFVYAATPIAMVEAFTTQNDEFAAMFVLIFAVLIIEFIDKTDSLRISKITIARYIALVLSIGFIYLSKPSGMFAVIVFTVWLFTACIRRKEKLLTIIFWFISVALGSVVVISPEVVRNIFTYGQVTDPWQGPGQLALTYDSRLLFVNYLKNIGNNLIHILWFWFGKTWTFLVYFLSSVLRVNADNELISEYGKEFSLRSIPVYSFDATPNIILTIFMLVSCVIGITYVIKCLNTKKRIMLSYSASAVICSLLIFTFVKWEVATARYFVAYFGLLAPALGLKIQSIADDEEAISKRKKVIKVILCRIIVAIGIIDVFLVVLFQLFYVTKQFPLIDKGRGYYVFSPQASYENQYCVLDDELRQHSSIGFITYGEQWAYAAIKVIDEHADEIRFVLVSNDSQKYESDSFRPEAIVFLGKIPQSCQGEFIYNGANYDAPKRLSDECAISYCCSR